VVLNQDKSARITHLDAQNRSTPVLWWQGIAQAFRLFEPLLEAVLKKSANITYPKQMQSHFQTSTHALNEEAVANAILGRTTNP